VRGIIVVALLLPACAAVPWPSTRHPGPSGPAPTATSAPWRDLRGVVHVHTRTSHDSPAHLEDLLRAAERRGIAWLGLTEHAGSGRGAVASGRRGKVTVLPGFEMHVAKGSLLALGIADEPPRTRDAADLVRWVHGLGGVAVVGHLERSRLADPEAFRASGADGVELVNLHALAKQHRWDLALRALFLPAPLALRALLRTPHDNLARLDALLEVRTLVGGADSHQKLRLLGGLGGTVDRYRDVLPLVTTHVWARDETAESILDALRAGRSYVAFEGIAPVDRLRIDEEGAGFRVEVPGEARLGLICDGVAAASAEGRSVYLAAPAGARRCRVDAWLGERLWIAASPRDAPLRASTRMAGRGMAGTGLAGHVP
jgi:hypothetical protein